MPVDLNNTEVLTPAQKELLDLKSRMTKGQDQIGALKGELKYWQTVAETRATELQVLADISKHANNIVIEPTSKTGKSESTAILCLCDWHVEEQVDPLKVMGMNEFNMKVADQRIKSAFKRGLYLINIWRAQTRIDNLVLDLKGDFINGFIHEDFVETNNMHPVQALLWVQDRLQAGIDYMLKEGGFKGIHIAGQFGNHGRTTPKKRVITRGENSYEWLLYHELANRYSDNPAIRFSIADGYFNKLSVYDRIYRLHHGDDVKYYGGVGGISIPVNKAIAEWNTAWVPAMDIFAHWHQFHANSFWVSCGSLIGYNPYAMSIKAKFEYPSQTVIFVEKDLGCTAALKVFLGK